MVDAAPSERAILEAFFLWIYTARAHEDGTVGQIIDEALAYPHPQSADAFHRQLQTWAAHDALDRLHRIAVPTLVIAGGDDLVTRPQLGQAVADRIPVRSSGSSQARPTGPSRNAQRSGTRSSTSSGRESTPGAEVG